MLYDRVFPDALKDMSVSEMKVLAGEIRQELISTVTENGGHLASNLGAVELTIALEYVFGKEDDKIIFDVGHQTYVHKMLTGRLDRFATLRQKDGLSGFPSRFESERDSFNAGHASTAISAAVGLARARDLSGKGGSIVAVVGDGALTGGMCYEAMNDAGDSKTKVILILNDNEMSISRNVGAVSEHLTALRQSASYMHTKTVVRKGIGSIPLIGKRAVRTIEKLRDALKTLLVGDRLFETLGFSYSGPINGHDIDALIRALRIAEKSDRPVVVHVVTQKGHGYGPAEQNPSAYHGLSPAHAVSDENKVSSGKVACEFLIDVAKKDSRICSVVAAMRSGTSTEAFFRKFPERAFDVGIAEEHAVEMAAGLAAGGMRPYVSIYSTFIQRAIDQIQMDTCLPRLPVVYLLDRAGFTGEDGATHQGLYDISYFRAMPDMTVAVPASKADLQAMLEDSLDCSAPMVIRFPKALPVTKEGYSAQRKACCITEGKDAAILCVGPIVYEAQKAARMLNENGITVAVYNMRYVKPLDEAMMKVIAAKFANVYTLEENTICGGFGDAVNEWFVRHGSNIHTVNIAAPDRFIKHATISEQIQECGMDANSIKNRLLNEIAKKLK